MRSGYAVLAAIVIAMFFVSGASAHDPTTLVIGARSEPETLNPLRVNSADTHDILNFMFIKLLEESGDFLTFEPRLAKSWSTSDDGLRITFNLRDDVRWWDGTPVTADDVRFTWELQRDTTVAWPWAEVKQHIVDVEVPDANTAVFVFDRRSQYQLMDAVDGVILPKHVLGKVPRGDLAGSDFSRNPMGNGPFKLVRWEPGQYIELAANDDYYEKTGDVRTVIFRFASDIVVLVGQIKTGEIDVLEAVPSDHSAEVFAGGDIRSYRYASRRFVSVPWNLKRPLFADRDIRTALALAVDRDAIIKTLYGSYARECVGPMSPLIWAYDASLEALPHDPERARTLLANQGWRDSDGDGVVDKDGKPFAFDFITTTTQSRIDVATMIAADLKKVGVQANIRSMEVKTYQKRLLDTDFDAALLGWAWDTRPDLGMWQTSGFRPDGFNFSSYSNADVDAALDIAGATMDMDEARRYYAIAQERIYDDQPSMFLLIPDDVTALSARFCNVKPNAISFFANVRFWKLCE